MSQYIDFKSNNEYSMLKEPANILKNGGIVVFPTETVYGIGASSLNKEAIKKLYNIKKRPLNKPISLLISNLEMVEQVAKDITELEYYLMKKFFPGPLTIILKKKDNVPSILTANGDTIGIRMPQNEVAKRLIDYTGVPLATPSANISGEPSGVNLKNIMKALGNDVDCFIDGGDSKIGMASTIIKIVDNIPYILRKGPISEREIKNTLINFYD